MFIIRNVAVGVVILNDLGIELQPSEEYNFSENESPNDVQNSQDLRDRIVAGDIVVLDPLDNVTALNTIRSQEVVDLANSPNYRIFGGDLNQLEDVDTATTPPVNGDVLTYNDSTQLWEPAAGVDIADLAGVSLGLTTSPSIPTTWGDVSWPTINFQNNTAIIERDGTLTDRILIKETGAYLIAFSISFDADAGEETIEVRVRVNDTTVLPGSVRRASEDDEINDLSNVFLAELNAGDFITLQSQASGAGNLIELSTTFTVMRAAGARGETGDQGPPGIGSTIAVEDEGVAVPGGPHDTLNFVGTGVTVTDAGSGEATVTVTGTSQSHLFRTNGATTQTFNTTPVTLLLGTNTRTDTEFSYSAGVVTVNEAGWYRIDYEVTTQATTGTGFFSTANATAQASIYINGVEDIDTRAYGWHHSNAGANITFKGSLKANLSATDDVEVRIVRSGGSNLGLQTVAQGCRLSIQSIDAP